MGRREERKSFSALFVSVGLTKQIPAKKKFFDANKGEEGSRYKRVNGLMKEGGNPCRFSRKQKSSAPLRTEPKVLPARGVWRSSQSKSLREGSAASALN